MPKEQELGSGKGVFFSNSAEQRNQSCPRTQVSVKSPFISTCGGDQ